MNKQNLKFYSQANNNFLSAIKSTRPHKDKSIGEIYNSLLVYRLSSIPLIRKAAPVILSNSSQLKIDCITNPVVKKTFFRHFCGYLINIRR